MVGLHVGLVDGGGVSIYSSYVGAIVVYGVGFADGETVGGKVGLPGV